MDAIVASGRYTEDELLDLAADHDPGFDRSWFAEALSAIDWLPDRLFLPYGKSVPLDVGYSDHIPEPIRRAVIRPDKHRPGPAAATAPPPSATSPAHGSVRATGLQGQAISSHPPPTIPPREPPPPIPTAE